MPKVQTNVAQPNKNIDKMNFRLSAAVSHEPGRNVKPKAPLGSIENPYKLGEKGSGIRLQGVVQDFNKLREQCLAANKLFEDPEFPIDDTSLWASERPEEYPDGFVWKRPQDIANDPQLFVDGSAEFDVKQGTFGNCWMVAALANLAMNKQLLYQVVPQDQSFQEKYIGIFHFRFWQFGKWVEVVIDDRLPIYNNELASIHSSKDNEFWSALVEKAYAKLHGYYAALENGLNSQALEDFTGGIANSWIIEDVPSNFFDTLIQAQKMNSLIGCAIVQPDQDAEINDVVLQKRGLVSGHAYSVTKVMYYEKKTKNQVEKIPLLRVRNPWGNFFEWKGAWGENSEEYKSIPKDKKKELGFEDGKDGQFWISFDDWKKHFAICEICYLNPSYLMMEDNKDEDSGKNWQTSSFNGEWVAGATAGGGLTNLESFQHNPQYLMKLENESKVVVALMQKNRRTQRAELDLMNIEFQIYKLPENYAQTLKRPLRTPFFTCNEPLDSGELLTNLSRQAICQTHLPPGSYCIIPYSAESNEGEFLLRVFSEKPNTMEEYDVQAGICDIDDEVLKNSNHYKDVLKMRKIFRNHAGDDWELNWSEYQNLMKTKLSKEMYDQGFSENDCRNMVTLLDSDNTGKIGYHEFQIFWNSGKLWMAAFEKYDNSNMRFLKPFQLREVLRSAGYRLSRSILNSLLKRYGVDNGSVKFDDYFMCVIRLNKMISAYNELTTEEINSAGLTLDNWLQTVAKFS